MKGPSAALLLLLLLAWTAAAADRGLSRHRRAAHLAADAVRRAGASRVTAYVCWGPEDAALVRLLSAAGLATHLLRGREHTRARHVRAALGDTANAIVVDAACPGAQRLLVLATRLRLFHIANTWIIFEDAALGSNPAATTASDDVDLRRDDEFDDLDNVTVYRYGAQNREDAVDPKEEAFLEVRPPMPPRARSGLLAPQSDRLSATAVQILDGKGMFVDSHVLWIQTTGQQVEALEVFRACLARPLQAYVVAVADLPDDPGGVPQWRWTMGGEEEALLRERRADLQGATLRGSTIIKYPEEYTDIEDNNLRKNDLYPKMNWPVTQNLAYSLNFGMLIYKRDNYGWDDGHGVFDGMIGEMQRHEHDMLATAVFIRPDRLPHIDLVAETFDMRTAVLFRQPSKSSVSNVYVLPFSPGVWRATGAVSLLALLLLVVQTQWWRSHRSSEQSDDPADHIEVGDCVTFIVGALSQQGFYCTPIMVSARITIITTFIANLFLFTSFSGSIVAIIQSPSTAIRSVQDLMQSEMKVGVQELPFQHVWFQEAVEEHDVASDVFNSKINTEESPGFLTTKEGIKKVRFERFAFQVETNEGYREILDTFTEPEKCDLSELELFPAAPMVFCTSEKSPYREALSRALRWHREVGLLDRIHNRWESQRPECSAQIKVFVPIGLQEFYPALLVLYNGMLLSLTVLGVEFVYNSRAVTSCLLRVWRREHKEKEPLVADQ